MNQVNTNHHGYFFETKLTKWNEFRERRYHVQTNYIIQIRRMKCVKALIVENMVYKVFISYKKRVMKIKDARTRIFYTMMLYLRCCTLWRMRNKRFGPNKI